MILLWRGVGRWLRGLQLLLLLHGATSASVYVYADMEFVQKFTPLDFQVKNFTPSILPNFNSFSKKKTQKMSENGEIYTAGKNFTLPPGLTGWTNFTSGFRGPKLPQTVAS